MTLRRTIAIISLTTLLLLTGCWKDSETPKSSVITRLPGNAVGFASFNLQDRGIEKYMRSPAYRDYMQELRNSSMIDSSMKAGWEAYFKVLEALGVLPGEGFTMPYADALVAAVPRSGIGLDLAAYYAMNSGEDGRPRLAKVKEILTTAGVKVEPSTGPGYDMLTITLFSGETADPVMEVYRDLGVGTLYLAASETMLSMSTAKPLAERGFGEVADESKSVLDRPSVKKALESVPAADGDAGYSYIDFGAAVKAYGADSVEEMPARDMGLKFNMSDGIGMRIAVLIDPKDEEQKKIFGALAGSTKGAALTGSPAGAAMIFALDTAAMLRVFKAAVPATDDPQMKQAEEMLKTVDTILIGLRPSTVGSPYPDAWMVAKSTDAKGVLAQINAQRAAIPLPDGMSWLSKESNGLKFDYLPTPFGVGAYLGATESAVVLATNEMTYTEVAKPKPDSEPAVIRAGAKVKTPALASIYLNYEPVTTMIESGLMAAAAFAPSNPQLDPKAYGYMKKMGEILLVAGYEPGVLHVAWEQRLPEK